MEEIKELSNETLVSLAPSIGATAAINGVSERYSFVPTIQAINYLRDSNWIPVQAGQAGVRLEDRRGFQKHMIRFTRPDLLVNGHRMDMLLYNSHDRGCAFQLIGGVFKFACANGLVIGDRMAEYSHRHVGFTPEKFIESAAMVGKHIEKVAGVVDDWQTIQLEEIEKDYFAQAAHKLIYDEPEKSPIRSTQLLNTRRTEDRNKSDLWTTFNTIQENTIKGGLRGRSPKGRRAKTRPVKSIDRNKKINKVLWELTQKMAELKGVRAAA
ncbi:DUF932 domain-containing protein [Desulfospira joergensenii]|uniref:DUF932 domain-containing protein n=1 Tax=Desulfospira joergensenii TaxID=53329 RepID=UPI0003B36E9B|nr:DUF932 domain-containing protein [Desulfospira joergensenii]